MIQRIQSVYLLVASILFGSTIVFRSVFASESMPWVVPVVFGLNALVGLVAFVALFQYADQTRQLKIVVLLQYLALVAILFTIAAAYLAGTVELLPDDVPALLALVFPLAGYVFIRLAGQNIKKDINLLRSVDRLRP